MLAVVLLSNVIAAALVAWAVVRFFKKPVNDILLKIIGDELAGAWSRYMRFVFYVTAVGGGTRIWALERYFFPAPGSDGKIPPVPDVTPEFLVFKIFRTILDTLTSLAWVLFAFFAITLVVYVAVKIFKNKTSNTQDEPRDES